MQFSSWKSTMPFEYWTIAPGAGQAFRQPGSAQCMQPSLRISHSSLSGCTSTSEKRINVHDWSLRSRGLSYTPTLVPISSRRSFHSMHATWQALQPMHLEMSMSLATSMVWRAEGVGEVVAERALISSDCRAMAVSSHFLDVDQERLELRRLGIGVAHEGGQGIGEIAVFSQSHEAPVDGDPDRMGLLAGHGQWLQAFGDHRHRHDEAVVRLHPHVVAGLDPLLLRQRLADLHE